MKTGLTSVTFRDKTAEEIIALCASAGLDGVEWGADVHVPPEAVGVAERVREMCLRSRVSVLSYGSYFYCDDARGFEPVLNAALALGAPVVRVWAGQKSPELATPAERERIYAVLRECVEKASREGVCVATEYHRHTLTETLASALEMLRAVPGLYTYWQPNEDISMEERLREITLLRPYLYHLHVFAWSKGGIRHPLSYGLDAWRSYMEAAGEVLDARAAILEFVKDGTAEQFLKDAMTLREEIMP